jgi:hypothetical protein
MIATDDWPDVELPRYVPRLGVDPAETSPDDDPDDEDEGEDRADLDDPWAYVDPVFDLPEVGNGD